MSKRRELAANSPAPAGRHAIPPAAVGRRSRRAAWWKRVVHSVAGMAGLIAAWAEANASPVAASSGVYRPATAVPQSWQVFARQVQARIEQQLAGDGDRARHVQDYLVRCDGEAGAPSRFVLRAWIRADGKVNRIEVDGIDDAAAAADLRALLIEGDVGVPPPAMLQPLHLRLSPRANDRPREGN
ncbi:hypothetical protein [Bradyrhizobium roseum]|uniref:hypothetical protein n=1 Tax=Bradyrhizobium roseum TaxID=3056648 RepID=UPI00262494B7|nr:hypothetical protein [Bradyrhizobium roseus]WKA26120.1 hypothetical protein QUH67_21155 [Bradyrhizobium roseus]